MDFSLTEQQLELKELTHQFAQNEMRPASAEHDEKNEFPFEVMKKAFEIGCFSGLWKSVFRSSLGLV